MPWMKPPCLIPSSIIFGTFKFFLCWSHWIQKKQQRKNVPFYQILLVFLMKVVGAIKKMDQMTDLLLTDELLMSMCGFNAYQVKKRQL